MAMTIAVGFVVDDAIVMIENIVRYIEKGDTPLEAALKGSGEIGFTIVSITISLVAVFIPLLLMGGMVGVLFREFAVTVTAAVVMSAFVSLTLTPVMCARFLHHETGERKRGRIDQACENAFNAVQRGYDRGLVWVLDHQPLTLAATVALAVLTGWLYVTIPKGLFPQQDTGFVFITVEGRQDISFAAMVDRQAEVTNALLQDPAVRKRRRLRRDGFDRSLGKSRAHVRAAAGRAPSAASRPISSSSASGPSWRRSRTSTPTSRSART